MYGTYQQQQKNRDIVAILQSSVVLSVILGSSQIFIFFIWQRRPEICSFYVYGYCALKCY